MAVIAAAVIGAVATGVGSYMNAQSAQGNAKQAGKTAIAVEQTKGDQARQTALYSALLAQYFGEKNKFNKAQGLANYTSYSKSQPLNPAYGALNSMMNYTSPNQVKDPGNAVPDPKNFLPNTISATSALPQQQQQATQQQSQNKSKPSLLSAKGPVHKAVRKVVDPLGLFG